LGDADDVGLKGYDYDLEGLIGFMQKYQNDIELVDLF